MDSTRTRSASTGLRRGAAIATTAALTLGGILAATAPASAAEVYQGVTLEWTGSAELQAAPPFGGSSYFSAGISDGTQAAYKASEGNVAIVQRSGGVDTPASYATRAFHIPAGNASRQTVLFSGGEATVADDGSAVVEWDGSWSINFYGGLVPFTLTDPVLSVATDGTGTLTVDFVGYASSMENPTVKEPLPPVSDVVLSTFSGVSFDSEAGFTVTPDYAGVTVAVPEAFTPQNTSVSGWGSWPQSFVDTQFDSGLSSYWYSSGGAADPKKAPAPFFLDFSDATQPETPEEPADGLGIGVTVPDAEAEPPSGTFGWAFESEDAIDLGTAVQAGDTFTANGDLNTIQVTDTRTGGVEAYDWSISGSVSTFTSGANSFAAGYLGWTPSVSNAGPSVTAGGAVTSTQLGGAGLGSAATLASSTAAASATIDAQLALVIPTSTPSGDYTATLTITAIG